MRDDFEAHNDDMILHRPGFDQENTASCPSDSFSTPKRPCRIPLCLPLGLHPSDFQALHSPAVPIELGWPDQPLPPFEIDNDIEEIEWRPSAGDAFVSSTLEKLRPPKHEWSDCVRTLGNDKDSLGRRWKMFIGDGNGDGDVVGLGRRGRGPRPRVTDWDNRSW